MHTKLGQTYIGVSIINPIGYFDGCSYVAAVVCLESGSTSVLLKLCL